MNYRIVYKNYYLSHHGIKGQKWGKRNGPPYPLDDSKIPKQKRDTRFRLNDNQKKILKIGAAVIGATLVAVGAYKVSSLIEKESIKSIVSTKINKELNIKNLGKSAASIDTDMVARINESNGRGPNQTNCFNCTTSYILNSLFGYNSTALRYPPKSGSNYFSYKKLFKNLKGIEFTDWKGTPKYDSLETALKIMPNGSTGIIGLKGRKRGVPHAIIYEKTKEGITTLIDPQQNVILDVSSKKWNKYIPTYGMDFSNAILANNIDKLLEDIVLQ